MSDQMQMQSQSGAQSHRQPADYQSQQQPHLQNQYHQSQTYPSSGPPPNQMQHTSTGPGEARVSMSETAGMVLPPLRSGPIYVARRRNFVQRNCSLCISFCKWLPVLFIVTVLCWGYYAYVVQLCFFNLQSVILRVVTLVVFHCLMVLCLWSYYQTIFTEPGKVPRDFWLTTADMDALNVAASEAERQVIFERIVQERKIPVAARTYTGCFRICEKCNLIKPDRAHHCSVCDACILKMDHHCPWVNNCVSFTNYKFFVLFLGYAFILCLFVAGTSFPFFLRFWKHDVGGGIGKLHIMFLFFVSIMFAISLASLFFYHIFLTLKNRSTLESFRTPIFRYGPDRKAYDLGKKENWSEIFGDSSCAWFLPVTSSGGDGLRYKFRMARNPDAGMAETGGAGFSPQTESMIPQSMTGDQSFPQYKSIEQQQQHETNGFSR